MTIIVKKIKGKWQRWEGEAHVNARKAADLVERGVWSEADLAPYDVSLAVPFEVPEGQLLKPLGAETFEEIDGIPHQVLETMDLPRRMVRKSVVLSRLTDQQIEAAIGLLTASQAERWRASDRPMVYFDDPETVAIVQAVGADPDVVMREGDEP